MDAPEQPDGPGAETPFRVSFVTGVMPDKWAERWRRRQPDPLALRPVLQEHQLDGLRHGEVAMAFVRLPVDRDGLHVIPLYTEDTVVVVSREHPVAAYDEISLEDLADEHLLQDPDVVPAWRDLATEVRDGTRHPVPAMTLGQVVESVAAQGGVAFLPRSVARVHHRKDVVAVPVAGLPQTQVALVWPREAEDPRVEAFVGVVRGRTENSSRGGGSAAGPDDTRAGTGAGGASGRRDRAGKGAGARSGRPRGSGGRKSGGRGSSGRRGRR